MVTRRDVVTTGVLGGIVAAGSSSTVEGASQSPETISAQALRDISEDVNQIRIQMREAFIGPSLAAGPVADLRKQFTIFLRANQKFPDFCEIGPGIFMELYDWHVRYQQALEFSRVDNRTALRFMFTWLILRPEQTETFIGIPFDR